MIMTQLIVLTGPQGSGKTQVSAALAQHFQLSHVVDEWDGASPSPADLAALEGGCLAVTNAELNIAEVPGATVMDIEAAKALLS
jgi:predicted ABC-type ATPase